MTNNKYDPWQGVGAEGTAALLIGLTALTGIPMSTTHTVVSAMVGAKAAQDVRSVHWATVGLVAWGWLLTPIFCGLSAYWLTGLIVKV